MESLVIIISLLEKVRGIGRDRSDLIEIAEYVGNA